MPPSVRSMACSYLIAGDVRVCKSGPGNDEPPTMVRARVRGRSARYFVRFSDGRWLCSCGEPDSCAHVAAVQLCTGHDGLAEPSRRKPVGASR
jgi:uncharacterized Zn finger protein